MTGAYRLLAACTLAGVLCVSGAAQSQPPPQTGGSQQSNLMSVLHLRPDQQGALQTYQASISPSPDEISQERQASSPQVLATLTTPQRLDRISAFLALQQQLFQRSSVATRAFYNQLSPDQQRTFDRVSAPRQGGGSGAPRN